MSNAPRTQAEFLRHLPAQLDLLRDEVDRTTGVAGARLTPDRLTPRRTMR
jgi:hypothetical protein